MWFEDTSLLARHVMYARIGRLFKSYLFEILIPLISSINCNEYLWQLMDYTK